MSSQPGKPQIILQLNKYQKENAFKVVIFCLRRRHISFNLFEPLWRLGLNLLFVERSSETLKMFEQDEASEYKLSGT